MRLSLIIIYVFCFSNSLAQEIEDSTEVWVCPIDPMPQYPGGNDSLQSFIKRSINFSGTSECSQGKVFVMFIVAENGSITKPEIARGICEEYNKEAIRVVNLMPKWKPATQNGVPIKTRVVIPITFHR